MIEKTAQYMAQKIKLSDPEGSVSVEVMSYELGRLMNLYGTIILTIIGGLITGNLLWTIVAMAGFSALRKYSGGIHMPSLTSCTIVSVAIFVLAPYVNLSQLNVLVSTLLSSSIMLISNNKNRKYVAVSVIIILSNLIIQSPALSVIFTIQSLTVAAEGGGILKQTFARMISGKLEKSAKNNIGTNKTFLGAQELPAELKNLKKESK